MFKSALNHLLFISIASLPNSVSAPLVGRVFHFNPWPLIYAIEPLKLPISSIRPLISLITTPILMRLLQFGPWFRISSIKSLIGP